MFAKLALRSLQDRKGSVLLSIMAMIVSIFVLLGVEHIRHQAKQSFTNSVFGVDLIVGAKTGSLNLLLYSIFRVGTPTNNISWQSFQKISKSPKVKWAVPIALGDSHQGYRVLGTNRDYFTHFSYARQRYLEFYQGQAFTQVFDLVLGADVAKKLGYELGDNIVLAHGIANTSFSMHDSMPFTVVGILAPTGTPVDQSLHVSLQGIEAIHNRGQTFDKFSSSGLDQPLLQPKAITAFMLGLTSKVTTFQVQRNINRYAQEPLMAILPGVAVSELWQMMSWIENTLLLVSVLVFIAGCLGVSAMLLSSIRERDKEIQLLRVIGASPGFLFLLIELEAFFMTLFSLITASTLLFVSLVLAQDYLVTHFGLHISVNIFSISSFYLMMSIVITSIVVAMIPSFIGYKQSNSKKTIH